jgi:hypothetical protein
MNGWVRFHGDSGDVVLHISGSGREPVSRLVHGFLEREWFGLEEDEQEDVELLAGLFVDGLPAEVVARRVKRARSTVGSERVSVHLHDAAAEVLVEAGAARRRGHTLFRR